METIKLLDTLPSVFEKRDDLTSEVWHHNVLIQRSQHVLIEANSGAGKSSLLSYIIGYRQDYFGRILFDDRDIRSLHVSDWVQVRQHNLSLLFQDLRLFPELTALENVEIKNNLTGFKPRKQIVEWFDALGIGDKLDAKVAHMSFGQQQRVAMIRALVQPFDFLLLDEPISHLDEMNSRVMCDIMLQEVHSQGAGVIVTSIGKHMTLPYDKTYSL
ncbi:MAG: ATP-binding cassette domain-containing protein [Bacteroidaceae bacterium]|jgi:ABC-type lipoprotein export system ATPase subunit|nr:ATP-binding cassette domain-containing protein [Bacteroidaceae bacterium]